MSDINQSYVIQNSSENLYAALTKSAQLAAWWTPEALSDAREGGYAKFGFGSMADMTMRIERLVPGKLVELSCIDASYNGQPSEWIGTRLRFELNRIADQKTELRLVHAGFPGETETFKGVTQGWAHFLGNSLKSYLEEGKAYPYSGSCPGKDAASCAKTA
jgi:uncharacterized protein YndB with AHSA1/START domain